MSRSEPGAMTRADCWLRPLLGASWRVLLEEPVPMVRVPEPVMGPTVPEPVIWVEPLLTRAAWVKLAAVKDWPALTVVVPEPVTLPAVMLAAMTNELLFVTLLCAGSAPGV